MTFRAARRRPASPSRISRLAAAALSTLLVSTVIPSAALAQQSPHFARSSAVIDARKGSPIPSTLFSTLADTMVAKTGAQPETQNTVFAIVTTDDGGEIVQGRSKWITLRVTNGTSDPHNRIGVKVAMGEGLSVTQASRNWACRGIGGSRPTCTFAGIVNEGKAKTLRMKVSAKDSASAGKKNIVVTPFVQGAKTYPAHTTVLRVVDSGDARMAPVVTFAKSSVTGAAAPRATAEQIAHVNNPFKYRIKIVNRGYDDLLAREKVVVSQSFGQGVRFRSVTTANGAPCTISARKWTCTLTASQIVAPGKMLDSLSVEMVPTAVARRVAVKSVAVKTPNQKEVEKRSMRIRAERAPDTVRFHTKDAYMAHVGGTSRVEVLMENIGAMTLPAGHVMTMKLPSGSKFVSATGKSWACAPKVSSQEFTCTYNRTLATNSNSRVLTVVTELGKKLTASASGYNLEFQSSRGWTRHKVIVEPLPVVTARAGALREDDGSSIITLTGDIAASNRRSYGSQWVQRCTTVEDARTTACPNGHVTPKLKLVTANTPNASAVVSAGAKARTYVFEYRAVTESVKVRDTVKVRVAPVSANGVSSMATSQSTIPTSVTSALATYGVVVSGSVSKPSSSGMVTQDFTLGGNIAKQLSIFGTSGQVQYSQATDTSTTCAVAALKTDNDNLFGKAAISDFYIVASRGGTCTWNGNNITTGIMSFSLSLFGGKTTFVQQLDPTSFFGNFSLSTVLKTFDVPLLHDKVTFHDVTLTIGVDIALVKISVSALVHTTFMGYTFELGGVVAWNKGTGQYSLDLEMAQAANYTSGGVTFANFSMGIGVSYYSNAPAKSMNITGTGQLKFMGQTVTFREITLDFIAGEIQGMGIDFGLSVNDPGGFAFNGDFSYNWRAASVPTKDDPNPLPVTQITAAVQFSSGGFVIGTTQNPARLSWEPACLAFSGPVVIPGVLSADVAGTLVLAEGSCTDTGSATGVTDFFAIIPVPGVPGDFRFDAENVQFQLGGIAATGNFSFGRVFEVPFGKIDMTATLTSRAANAKIYVKGDVDPINGINVKSTANLNIGGFNVNADVNVVLTVKTQKISLATNMDVAGISVAFSGYAGVVTVKGVPMPSISLSGSSRFKVEGYDLGDASFSLVESPTNMGMSADVDLNLGPLSGDASASFVTLPSGALAYVIKADGELKWNGNSIDVKIASTNCNDTDNCTKTVKPSISLNGGVRLSGKYFGMGWFDFNPDFSFYVEQSDSGSETVEVPDAKAVFIYSYDAILSSKSPYVHLDSDLEAKGYLRYDKKWYKEVDTRDDIEFSLDPFYISAKLCIKSLGCIKFHT